LDTVKENLDKTSSSLYHYNKIILAQENTKNRTFLDAVSEDNKVYEEYSQFNNINFVYSNKKAFNYLINYEASKNLSIFDNVKFELFKDLGIFNDQYEHLFNFDHQQFGNMQNYLGINNNFLSNENTEDIDTKIEEVTKITLYIKENIDDFTAEEITRLKIVRN